MFFLRRLVSVCVLVCFLFTFIIPPQKTYADPVLGLPQPGTMVNLTPAYVPVIIKGLRVHPENPILFDFIVDTGNSGLSTQDPQLRVESEKLIKYFLASLTIPEDDLWVNLSPYEKNRIIPGQLGQTEMGRDMLAEDYILKQLTASLIYPEKSLGKEFWNRVYAKAQEQYGTSEVPVNTFNKVWIVADKAKVYVHANTAFVIASHLKVMLEEDYLALQKHSVPLPFAPRNDTHSMHMQLLQAQAKYADPSNKDRIRAQKMLAVLDKYKNAARPEDVKFDQAMSNPDAAMNARTKAILLNVLPIASFIGLVGTVVYENHAENKVEHQRMAFLEKQAISVEYVKGNTYPSVSQDDYHFFYKAHAGDTAASLLKITGGNKQYQDFILRANKLRPTEALVEGELYIIYHRHAIDTLFSLNGEPVSYLKELIYGDPDDSRPIILSESIKPHFEVVGDTLPKGIFIVRSLVQGFEEVKFSSTIDKFYPEASNKKPYNFSSYYQARLKETGDRAQINPGGVDLNSRNMDLDVSGEKVDVRFDKGLADQFRRGDFTGVRPVIFKIAPLASVLALMGFTGPQGHK